MPLITLLKITDWQHWHVEPVAIDPADVSSVSSGIGAIMFPGNQEPTEMPANTRVRVRGTPSCLFVVGPFPDVMRLLDGEILAAPKRPESLLALLHDIHLALLAHPWGHTGSPAEQERDALIDRVAAVVPLRQEA